jgi:hypothetical protein
MTTSTSALTKDSSEYEARHADGQQVTIYHPSVFWPRSKVTQTPELFLFCVVRRTPTRSRAGRRPVRRARVTARSDILTGFPSEGSPALEDVQPGFLGISGFSSQQGLSTSEAWRGVPGGRGQDGHSPLSTLPARSTSRSSTPVLVVSEHMLTIMIQSMVGIDPLPIRFDQRLLPPDIARSASQPTGMSYSEHASQTTS